MLVQQYPGLFALLSTMIIMIASGEHKIVLRLISNRPTSRTTSVVGDDYDAK